MHFRQCAMVRRGLGGGTVGVYTAWIPEKFAKVGMVLSLKVAEDLGSPLRHDDKQVGSCLVTESSGRWMDGWEVTDVYTRATEEYVREYSGDHRRQREASDKFTPNKGLGLKE